MRAGRSAEVENNLAEIACRNRRLARPCDFPRRNRNRLLDAEDPISIATPRTVGAAGRRPTAAQSPRHRTARRDPPAEIARGSLPRLVKRVVQLVLRQIGRPLLVDARAPLLFLRDGAARRPRRLQQEWASQARLSRGLPWDPALPVYGCGSPSLCPLSTGRASRPSAHLSRCGQRGRVVCV